MMAHFRSIADIRREYGELALDDATIPAEPLQLFNQWLEEVLKNEHSDPTAVVLSTVDENGFPDSRVVLLKGINEGNFIFYTNYHSKKAQQLHNKPYAALNFYWPDMARQVRIRGRVEQVEAKIADAYFASRPRLSQISAIASPQSKTIPNRDFLEAATQRILQEHQEQEIMRPDFWGGFKVCPVEIEFWQGRDNRLHDRIQYQFNNQQQWEFCRLAP